MNLQIVVNYRIVSCGDTVFLIYNDFSMSSKKNLNLTAGQGTFLSSKVDLLIFWTIEIFLHLLTINLQIIKNIRFIKIQLKLGKRRMFWQPYSLQTLKEHLKKSISNTN